MAGDPRVQAMDKIRSALSGYAEGFTDGGVAARRALAALGAAALSASPPGEVGVGFPVRAAVAASSGGKYYLIGSHHLTDVEMMQMARNYHRLNGGGEPGSAAFLTATVPLPVVAEIAASVSAAGEG